MKTSIRKGFGFGLTSGIITTLGLMVGLNSSTHSAIVVIGGIIVIAVADALSDALGIHISEEFEMKHSKKEIWESTISTFLSKLVFALTFVVPVLLFSLNTAIIVSVVWGLFLITVFSIYIAKEQNLKPYRVVMEHLVITVIVILITHYLGRFVGSFT